MKYRMLRKFLGLKDGEKSVEFGPNHSFSCGIGWYSGICGLVITRGVRGGIHSAAFVVVAKDKSRAWRKRMDDHTSCAQYDLTVTKQVTPQ